MLRQIVFVLFLIISSTTLLGFHSRHVQMHWRGLKFTTTTLVNGANELNLHIALNYLRNFDANYNERIKQGKQQGQSPQVVEFYRAQVLKSEGMLKEREDMKTNLNIVKCSANEIVLGILAESGSQGLTTLRSWVEGLQIARGVLNAFDQAGREINVDALNNSAVYIKYNSTDCGNAYMKPSPDEGFAGVVFQPKFSNPIEGEFFHQFGNFPLWLFS